VVFAFLNSVFAITLHVEEREREREKEVRGTVQLETQYMLDFCEVESMYAFLRAGKW
jgi:hypothetical protein